MTASVQPLPVIGGNNSTEDPKILALLAELQGIVNGNVDANNLAGGAFGPASFTSALAQVLGVSQVGTARRGYAEVLTSQSTTSAAYVGLATAGPSVTVTQPTGGLTFIHASVDQYTAGVGSAAYSAIRVDGTTDRTFAISNNTSSATYVTCPGNQSGVAFSNTMPGGAWCFDLSGTHAYSMVHSDLGGGTGTFANRKLRVWTVSF